MNFGQMQTALMRYGFDVTDPITTWLNAALEEFTAAVDWPWLEAGPVTIPIPAGQNSIPLPADFAKVLLVRDLDNMYPLKYWERHHFVRSIQDQTQQGLAEVFTLISTDAMQIWRVPVVATNFELIYQANNSPMVLSTDVPSTLERAYPTYTHYPLVMRAASIALQAENEEDRAKTAQDQYEKGLMLCIAQVTQRELGDTATVEDAQGYGDIGMMRGW